MPSMLIDSYLVDPNDTVHSFGPSFSVERLNKKTQNSNTDNAFAAPVPCAAGQ